MIWQQTPYTVPLLVGAFLSAVSAVFTWRHTRVPGARSASLLLLTCSEWMATYALETASLSLSDKLVWNKLEYIGIVVVPMVFFMFALSYTGRSKWITRRNLVLLGVEPVAVFLLVLTNDMHRLIWTANLLDSTLPFTVLVNEYGVGFWLHAAYSYGLLIASTWLLVQLLVRSRQLYGLQASALLIAALVPWIGNGLYLAHLEPFPKLDLTPLAFTISSLCIAWGLSGLRLGDIASVSRRSAIDGMSDAFLVLDPAGAIMVANPAARNLLGEPDTKLVGRLIQEVWPAWHEQAEPYSKDALPTFREMTLNEGGKKSTYDVRFSPLTDWRGWLVSQVVVFRDITERKRLEEELADRYQEAKNLADRDGLTGLLNHRAVHERLEQELKRAQRYAQQCSIVIMDLDGFKLFNDTYGHPVGDSMLRIIAGLLAEKVRGSDSLSRYGGDEFMAVLPGTDANGAAVFAGRVREALAAQPYSAPQGAKVPIHMSFGLATFPQNGLQSQKLVAVADGNLFESKQRGGETVTGERVDDGSSSGTFEILDGLVTAVDHKDHYTRKHSDDVTEYAMSLAGALNLSEESLRTVRTAALLHDVGKIGVPDRILRKPGNLDDNDVAVMAQHVLLGELIIKGVPNCADVVAAVGSHHERVDGAGYPRGLKGDQIPLVGRMLAVADAYSAMTSERPYCAAKPPDEARAELLRVSGTQLDPELVRVFLSILDESRR
ncbi:MAG: histidine kinase N-terminal 7TM domain-containing protein [Dehalococcoidia bacterium]|nr:histidine kinase N-terminal 7TM domain-containing protein [Dehalococcoidia bacterium]